LFDIELLLFSLSTASARAMWVHHTLVLITNYPDIYLLFIKQHNRTTGAFLPKRHCITFMNGSVANEEIPKQRNHTTTQLIKLYN
jgi:hypothetical protein